MLEKIYETLKILLLLFVLAKTTSLEITFLNVIKTKNIM